MILPQIFEYCHFYSDKWNGYFEIYERHLNHFRDKPVTLVEIGVQGGGSLEMWGKYLGPDARIIGIDLDPNCQNLEYTNPNIKVITGDQADPIFWNEFLSKVGNIDILLDDGGHVMNQQVTSFECVFPRLPVGSVYICEDCHTSYWPDYDGGLGKPGSFIEYSKSIIDTLNINWINTPTDDLRRLAQLTHGLTDISFYNSVVVFEKFGKRNMQRVLPAKHTSFR